MKKYTLLNCINWRSLDNLPLQDADEFTYFVLPVSEAGSLLGINEVQEKKFVADVHGAGKKATFSVAGGEQNVANITSAVTLNRTAFVSAIAQHMEAFGYDGVTIDIENTAISPEAMVAFFKELRTKLGTEAIIGCYTQPYQLNTVWAKVAEIKDYITWISPMLYDYPNSVEQIKSTTAPWVAKVGKDKVLLGAAVNYDGTGFDEEEWPKALDIVIAEGWAGVGIWQNNLYTQEYRDILRNKFAPALPTATLNDVYYEVLKISRDVNAQTKLELVEDIVWGAGTLSSRMNKLKVLLPNA